MTGRVSWMARWILLGGPPFLRYAWPAVGGFRGRFQRLSPRMSRNDASAKNGGNPGGNGERVASPKGAPGEGVCSGKTLTRLRAPPSGSLSRSAGEGFYYCRGGYPASASA